MAPHLRRHLPDRLGHRRGRPTRPLAAGGEPAAGLPGTPGRPAPLRPDGPGGGAHPEGPGAPRPGGRLPRPARAGTGGPGDRPGPGHGSRPAVRLVGRVLLGRGGAPAAARRPGSGGEIRNRSRQPGPPRPRRIGRGRDQHGAGSPVGHRHAGRHQAVRAGRRPGIGPNPAGGLTARAGRVVGREAVGGLQRRAAHDPSVLAVRPRSSVRRRPPTGGPRPPGGGGGRRAGTGVQPAPRLLLCRGPGPGIHRRTPPGGR